MKKLGNLHYEVREESALCTEGQHGLCHKAFLGTRAGEWQLVALCTCSCHPFNRNAEVAAA